MRISVVLRYIGVVMLFMALAMLMSAVVAYVSYRDSSHYVLLLSALLTALLGSFPLIFVKSENQISNKEGYCIVLGSWLLACVVTMFPFLMWGGEFSLENAWFESVSGLTTTGASALNDIEALPRGLLFWRMSSTWIGGIGVIMFALVILPSMGRSKLTLSNMEVSAIAKGNYHYHSQAIVRIILVVYVGLTAVTTILLKLAGMNWYDALTHAMSASATSGFGTKNTSIAYFDSPMIEGILIFAMFLAGTHFGMIYATVTGKFNNIFRSEVMRFYVCTIVVCSLLMGLNLYVSGFYPDFWTSMRQAVFQFVSLITTTGYATVDTNPWPPLAIILLLFGTISCACAGSTTGGLKINRVLIAFKIFKQSFKQQQHPNAIFRVKVDGVTQDDSLLSGVMTFIILYMVFVLSGTIVGAVFGLDVMSAFSSSLACIGNVGPGFGDVGSMNNYSEIPTVYKYYLTFLMLLGRLEIFGLIQLFFINMWK